MARIKGESLWRQGSSGARYMDFPSVFSASLDSRDAGGEMATPFFDPVLGCAIARCRRIHARAGDFLPGAAPMSCWCAGQTPIDGDEAARNTVQPSMHRSRFVLRLTARCQRRTDRVGGRADLRRRAIGVVDRYSNPFAKISGEAGVLVRMSATSAFA